MTRAATISACPVCGTEVRPEPNSRFDCAGCGNRLVLARTRAYRIARIVGIYGLGTIWALKRGWELCFVLFVVSFYVFPVKLVWDTLERDLRAFFPLSHIEVVRDSPFQTLSITRPAH